MTKMTSFVHVDLNFNLHISNISKSADKQLNAFMRSKCFLAFEEKMVLINSLILLNFYLAPLPHISSADYLFKLENLQKQVLRFF